MVCYAFHPVFTLFASFISSSSSVRSLLTEILKMGIPLASAVYSIKFNCKMSNPSFLKYSQFSGNMVPIYRNEVFPSLGGLFIRFIIIPLINSLCLFRFLILRLLANILTSSFYMYVFSLCLEVCN